ncbi:MAG: hypothetical protein V4438_01995 [Patescibacteria group bacterium]
MRYPWHLFTSLSWSEQVTEDLKAARVKIKSFEILEYNARGSMGNPVDAYGTIEFENDKIPTHVWHLSGYRGYSTGFSINAFFHNRKKNKAIKAYIRLRIGEYNPNPPRERKRNPQRCELCD